MDKIFLHVMRWGFPLLLVGLLLLTCSVKAPEVTVTGEKTALENQVIGTYQQIEQDAWTLASVRSATPGQQPAIPREKKKVIEAIQGRKFNKDDVDEFKKAGLVGENNMGLLEIRNPAKLEADPDLKTRVTKIVESENTYRQIIMERIMLLNESAAQAGNENVARIFSKMNQDSSEPGTWIQRDDGTWVKKGQ